MKYPNTIFFMAASFFCYIHPNNESIICQQALISHTLIEAIKRGNTPQVISLLRKKIDPNAANQHRSTALHFASYAGKLSIARLLIAAKANINAQNSCSKDFSFAHIASEHGGVTPLMLACATGNANIVMELLKNGALVDQQDDLGQTALTYILLSNKEWPNKKLTDIQKNIINALLNSNANPYIEDDYGLTPLYYYERIAELMYSNNQWIVHPQALQNDTLYLKMLYYKAC